VYSQNKSLLNKQGDYLKLTPKVNFRCEMVIGGSLEINAPLKVGEVAKRAGVTIATLHFYEKKGLIFSSRSDGNQRLYSRDVLRRIAIIKVSQNVGIPLIEIKQALSVLPKFAATTQKDWQVLSSNWHATLDAKIKNLVLLRDQLENCIGCGCLSVKECPIRNPGDILGKQGSGAVLLRTKP